MAVNVANFIGLDESGHALYGIGYISCQVLQIHLLGFHTMSRYCHHLRSPKYRILSLYFQVLNLLIVLGMISFNNHFLDGKFYELGFAWVGTFFDGQRDSSYAVLYHMFPRMTICEFQSYGSAGNQILKIGQSGL